MYLYLKNFGGLQDLFRIIMSCPPPKAYKHFKITFLPTYFYFGDY